MPKRISWIVILVLMALLLGGCGMLTAEQMYCLPKRSEDYNNLQSAIDSAMIDLAYCAPRAGENQQPVQMVDLDGDGVSEYLLFAKSNDDRPLQILIFRNMDGKYVHTDTVESNGTAFDQVEYVQMDDEPGLEIVVGCQVSAQVVRTLSVYTMHHGDIEQLLSVNYTKFMPLNLDGNEKSELFLIRPGNLDTDNGIVELYSMGKGTMERSNEASLSQPASKLKRVIVGQLYGGTAAVYVASAVDETTLVTDVFAVKENKLINVALSNEAGTSVQTMRNYYVYADDMDGDGVVELPQLMTMKPLSAGRSEDRYYLIRWYAMSPEGEKVEKVYTFHNFLGGWYMHLDTAIASRITVSSLGSQFDFYLWDENYKSAQKLMTVYAYTGQNREEQATVDGRFVLHRTESTVYAASLELLAEAYGLTRDSVIYSFRMIQQAWNTGET